MPPASTKFVDTPALQIAYEEAGDPSGTPVILLHGFPYDARAYDGVVASLASEPLRLIIPYLRGYGPTRFRTSTQPRSGQQAALGADLLALMDALHIETATLVGYDWGGRAACVVAALWPERVAGLVSMAASYNIQDIAASATPADPAQEHRFWYQFYLHGERGRQGLRTRRREFCRLLWTLWSPTWHFGEEEYARTATSFDNPDFVDVVVSSYRHRFGLAEGDPELDKMEAQLAAGPAIAVATILLHGRDDGVDPPEFSLPGVAKFSRLLTRRVLPGVGHNVPQEAPQAVADAILNLTTRR